MVTLVFMKPFEIWAVYQLGVISREMLFLMGMEGIRRGTTVGASVCMRDKIILHIAKLWVLVRNSLINSQ